MTGKQMLTILASDAKGVARMDPVDIYYKAFIYGSMFGAKYPEDVTKMVAESGMGIDSFNKLTTMADGLHEGPPDD